MNIQNGVNNSVSNVTGLPFDEKTWTERMKEFLKSNIGNGIGSLISIGGGYITIESVKVPVSMVFKSIKAVYSGVAHVAGAGISGFITFVVAGLIEALQAYCDYQRHGSKGTLKADIKRIVCSNLGAGIATATIALIAGICKNLTLMTLLCLQNNICI